MVILIQSTKILRYNLEEHYMDKGKKCVTRLSSCGLGVAFGVTWGLGVFLLGIFNIYGDWGGALLDVLSSLYIGFDYTIKGAFIGLLWGLAEGFICGTLIGCFYNLCLKHCPCKSCKSSSCRTSGNSCCE
jgi:hypothetical protein